VPPPLSAATRVVDNSEQGSNNVGVGRRSRGDYRIDGPYA
jgi:hypothetical protein